MSSVEKLILDNLVTNEEYGRKTLPFLRSEYFHNHNERTIFDLIEGYVLNYNAFPSKDALMIDLANREDLSDDSYEECQDIIKGIRDSKDEVTKLEYLVDKTEEFCQNKAIYNAIMESIKIMDGKTQDLSKGSIPNLLSEALGVSFDTNIGHDFLEDAEERFEFYHKKEERLPFDIEYFNKITKGGLPKKTLNVILAPTGVGKSLIMCHMAAANLAMGKNVLYISMEMAEERIAERIDANLLNVELDDLKELPRDSFLKKVNRVKSATVGKLVVKEYPTSGAGSANFRHLLNELKLKKNFKPDIIYIDYLNICCSSRVKNNGSMNSYFYIKHIAEELRGLAVEFDLPIVSATQTSKDGFNNSDIDITNTSESMALTHTVDFYFAVVSTEELEALGQFMIIQLKNRYSDLNKFKRFVIGVHKAKMKLYDVEQRAQEDIVQDRPVMDKAPAGRYDPKPKLSKDVFEGFK